MFFIQIQREGVDFLMKRPENCCTRHPCISVATLYILRLVTFVAICFDICHAQIIIAESSTFLAANPAKLTETDFSEFIAFCPDFSPAANTPAAQRISTKLDAHVARLLRAVGGRGAEVERKSNTLSNQRATHYPTLRRLLQNPNGIQSFSPGLRGTSYPGSNEQ
jgi:hypothetical protein